MFSRPKARDFIAHTAVDWYNSEAWQAYPTPSKNERQVHLQKISGVKSHVFQYLVSVATPPSNIVNPAEFLFFDQCNKSTDCFVDMQYYDCPLRKPPVCYNLTYNGDLEMLRNSSVNYVLEEALHNGTFALIFSNSPSFSQHLYDVLRVGSIPVVVGTDALLPFSEYLDWTQTVLTIPRRNLPFLMPMLRSIPKNTIYRLRKAGRYFLENYVGNSKGSGQLYKLNQNQNYAFSRCSINSFFYSSPTGTAGSSRNAE